MTKADAAFERCWPAVRDKLAILREKGSVAVPDDDTARQAVLGCINTKNGKWRRTKPKSDPGETLWTLVKFHRSGGSLYGWPWFAPKELVEPLDTLAVVLLNGESRAADAWQRAIHG